MEIITDKINNTKKIEKKKKYYMGQDIVSLYVREKNKEQRKMLAKTTDYKTVSNLVRTALKFFIEYNSKIKMDKNIGNDFLSSLSHELKGPLTSIKGYLQLIIEAHGDKLEKNIKSTLNKVLDRCDVLESKIIEYLDEFDIEEEEIVDENNIQYDLLIIEDDVETLTILIDYFKSLGIACKGVENGYRGLKEIYRVIPKVILLDIILPDISGYDIMKKIRSDKNLRDIPTYFLTAIPIHKVEKKAEELEATGYISKPFSLSDFKDIIKYLKNGM